MKGLFKTALLCSALFVQSCVMADDKPIQLNQMPANVQQVVKTHFADQKIAIAKVDGWFWKEYDVVFTNGNKIEFDSKGNWTEVECKNSEVPASLVPAAIAKYVKENYPQAKVMGLSRDRQGYDVKLANGIELEFNQQYQLIDIDD
ncbi:MAG: PepSY-like domain-containing protein [Bacteroidaceae bacterium]|nr:PepSY-like domain-containing protein [Bacteroidaceae bacterium]